jgi:putative pyruvate formate lyase activating enzyme
MKILNKVVDVFLPDFKYGNDRCAYRLSDVENYFKIITRNLKLIDGEIVIRHLILSNHIECCSFPILEWLAENLKDKVIINIMDQYTPHYRVLEKDDYQELTRKITKIEFERVLNKARELGLNVIPSTPSPI